MWTSPSMWLRFQIWFDTSNLPYTLTYECQFELKRKCFYFVIFRTSPHWLRSVAPSREARMWSGVWLHRNLWAALLSLDCMTWLHRINNGYSSGGLGRRFSWLYTVWSWRGLKKEDPMVSTVLRTMVLCSQVLWKLILSFQNNDIGRNSDLHSPDRIRLPNHIILTASTYDWQ